MLLIWRGFGWAIPVVSIAVLIGVELGVETAFKEDNYYQLNAWPKYIAAIILAIAIGSLGYVLNYRAKKVVFDETDEKNNTRSKPHALFFIPVQYWAIIIPVLLTWVGYSAQQDSKKAIEYLNEIHSGDVYLTDFSKVFSSVETSYKYGLLKVEKVNAEKVSLLASKSVYNIKKGPKDDVVNGKDKVADYFEDKSIGFTDEELRTLFYSGAIYKVIR